LRTPLDHIVGYSEMLLEEMADRGEAALSGDLMEVRAASERLLDTCTRVTSTEPPEWSMAALRVPVQIILDRTERLVLAAKARAEESWGQDLRRINEAARQLDACLDAAAESRSPTQEGELAAAPVGAKCLVTDAAPGSRLQTPGGLILVIDDNDSNLDMLSRRLARAGHLVATAHNGPRGLELLREHPFDLVLLDVTMSEMDGFQVLQHLKDDAVLRHLPVIMLSAFDELARVVRCIEAGADDYLSKPINATLLNARIAACLGKKRLRDRERDLYAQLQEEQGISERLLLNVLPAPIAARLKNGETTTIADSLADVSVLFADLVDFTRLSAALPPAELVALLGEVFSTFDELATRRGLEKIKTIGDAYMAVGGLPATAQDHVEAAADMALDIQEALSTIAAARGRDLRMRLGIHSGPVVAGVIWQRKFTYDLWGDTVNIASRMESQGLPGHIQISADTRARLGRRFRVEGRGLIDVKGRGDMETYLLLGRSG
jgi:adenylate cyclase